jgi:hypothetical protein
MTNIRVKFKGIQKVFELHAETVEYDQSSAELRVKDANGEVMGWFKTDQLAGWWIELGDKIPDREIQKVRELAREMKDELSINEAKYSGELSRILAAPDPEKFYRFVRKGEAVTVTEFRFREVVQTASSLVPIMMLFEECPICGGKLDIHMEDCILKDLQRKIRPFTEIL